MLHRCPACGLAGIKARKDNLTPRFKCYKCKATFDEPHQLRIQSQSPRTARAMTSGWVDLPRSPSGLGATRALGVSIRRPSSASDRCAGATSAAAVVADVDGARWPRRR